VALPRGSEAELIMRNASSDSIVLDLESVVVNGHRYAISSPAQEGSIAKGCLKLQSFRHIERII
jgi:hypothetical protein